MSTNVREFLLRVLPWPGDDLPGFINAHAMLRMPDGKKPWTGTPTRDVDSFLQTVHTMLGWRTPPEIYMCMSRQSETKVKGDKLRAAKSQEHALAIKSVFLDIDIKPKAFATLGEAMAALAAFCAKYKLPNPTALVASGGGLHAHWISDHALAIAEWQPYADGMKAAAMEFFGPKIDAGVIADSARVLRVPGTFNYKQPTPRPVKLLGMKDHDYDFASTLHGLVSLSPVLPRPQTTGVLAGQPDPRFLALPIESLAEGIGRSELPPLDPTPLGKECGWFREALTTGGKGFSQGLWNLSTLAATFMENGNALAHRMARGHPGYHQDETEALWDRKTTERRDHGLGWPSCRAIQAEGCTHCASCPRLAMGKSPLNLGRIPQPQPVGPATFVGGLPGPGAVAQGVAPAAGAAVATVAPLVPITTLDLPPGYVVQNNVIFKELPVNIKGQPPSVDYLPLFHSHLYTVWAQVGPDALNFTTSTDLGSYHDVQITLEQMTSMELEHALRHGRVKPVGSNEKHMKDFMLSWLSKLHEAAAAQTSTPFGWHMNNGFCEGFSYGSVMYKHDGTRGPVGPMDKQTRAMYEPIGDEQPWLDLFRVIVDQKRLGLQAIVAASFGSTLMFATGKSTGLMSVWGETGVGKSTAMKVAIGIWGNPKLAKENEGATQKYVLERLGQIRNLPYMWDEIKDEPAQDKVNMLLFRSDGKGDSRLTSNIEFRGVGTWENITGIASNSSFADYLIKKNPNHAAGLVRLFEWREFKPKKGAPGQLRHTDVSRMERMLEDHHGQTGKRWAAFLGPNRDLCAAHVVKNLHWFEDAVEDPNLNTSEERFWVSLCAAIQSGAELANEHLGLNFDTVALRAWLVKTYHEQRSSTRNEGVEGGSYDWTENNLTAFLKAYGRCTLWTNTGNLGRKGRQMQIDILHAPDKMYPIQVHWVQDPGQLIISKTELGNWCKATGTANRLMRSSLVNHFGARQMKGTLGAGCTLGQTQEEVILMPVQKDTVLWDVMMRRGAPPIDVTAPVTSGALLTADTAIMLANPDAKEQ